jgi:hypothetical protein
MSKIFCILTNAKLIRNFLIWGLCISLHKYVSNLVYIKGVDITLDNVKPLYDIIQQNFPNLQPYRIIPEFLHVIPILYFFYKIIYNLDNNSTSALIKMLEIHAQLMLLRCICFSVTLLPDSSQMCRVSNHIGSCYDLIFSGHSTAMFLSTYILRDYFKLNRIKYSILQFNNLITSFLIIVCRNHYTIDVIVAYIATNYLYFRGRTQPTLIPYYKCS